MKESKRPQRGVRCKTCSAKKNNENRKDPSKTTCPLCSNQKSYGSKVCKGCVDQSGDKNGMFGKKNPSAALRNRQRKPEDHWNWKGGICKDRDSKTISWSKHVREAGECDRCSFNNPLALDAHHLDGYDNFPELRYEMSNGVCLCKNCHTIFHKTYGYGNNTSQQYFEFKEEWNG